MWNIMLEISEQIWKAKHVGKGLWLLSRDKRCMTKFVKCWNMYTKIRHSHGGKEINNSALLTWRNKANHGQDCLRHTCSKCINSKFMNLRTGNFRDLVFGKYDGTIIVQDAIVICNKFLISNYCGISICIYN